mgnify:CR=1 FL=1
MSTLIDKLKKVKQDRLIKRNFQEGGLNRRQTGGMALPGGQAVPILGSDAVEFSGATHNEGGIMLDNQTEVEDGETMDQVTMAKKGGKRGDYFFSSYLKKGGRSFADLHKQILASGGNQEDIDYLAKMQEATAGRNPNVVQTAKLGGVMKYQTGGDKKPVRPKRRDYQGGSQYNRALQQYYKDLEAWEAKQADIAADLPIEGDTTVTPDTTNVPVVEDETVIPEKKKDPNLNIGTSESKVRRINKRNYEHAKEIFEANPEATTREEKIKLLQDAGYDANEINNIHMYSIDADDNILPFPGEEKEEVTVATASKAKEQAAKDYTVSTDDLIKQNDGSYIPKEGAISTEADRAIWKDGQWTDNPEYKDVLVAEETEPPISIEAQQPDLVEDMIASIEEKEVEHVQTKDEVRERQRLEDEEKLKRELEDLKREEELRRQEEALAQNIELDEEEDDPDDFPVATEEEERISLLDRIQDYRNRFRDKRNERRAEREMRRLRDLALGRRGPGMPIEALAGIGVQGLPALYAFLHKDKPVTQQEFDYNVPTLGMPGRVERQRVEAPTKDTERAMLKAAYTGNQRFIDTSGVGGGSAMANRQALFSKYAQGLNTIGSQEAKEQIQARNLTGQLRQQASISDLQREQQAAMANQSALLRQEDRRWQTDVYNTQMKEAERQYQEDKKLSALDNLAQLASTGVGDYLDYAAEDLKAKSKGLDVNARANVIDRLMKTQNLSFEDARVKANEIMKMYTTDTETSDFVNPALSRNREDQYSPESLTTQNFWNDYLQRQ